jgi:hypothetical protein
MEQPVAINVPELLRGCVVGERRKNPAKLVIE